ncbi:sodium/solute symporter [Streptomyces sp. NPDC001177]
MNPYGYLAVQNNGFISPITSFMLVMIGSFLLCLIVGIENDRVSGFFLADRSLSTLRNCLALCGDFIVPSALLSLVGAVALSGYDGMFIAVSAIGVLWVLLPLAEPLRNTGGFTLGGILESRIPGAATRIAGTVVTVMVCVPMTVVQLTVAGDVTSFALGLHGVGASQICTALIGLLIVSYAAFGGMRGTSMIQIGKTIFVIGATLALTRVVLGRFHWDLGAMVESAGDQHGGRAAFYSSGLLFGDTGTGMADLFSLGLSITLGGAGLPHILMRMNVFQTGRAARRATRSAVTVLTLCYCAMAVAGLGAAAVVGSKTIASSNPQGYSALFLLSDSLGGNFLFALVSCAVFITALSTLASFILAAAASIAHDVYAGSDRRGRVKETNEVKVARWAIVIFGVLNVFLAVVLHNWSILSLASFGAVLSASAALPALTYVLFWRGFTKTGMLWTLYGSLACCTVLELFSPAVSGTPYSFLPEQDFHWFPLQNIGLVSIPVGFFLGWAGSLLSRPVTVPQPVDFELS